MNQKSTVCKIQKVLQGWRTCSERNECSQSRITHVCQLIGCIYMHACLSMITVDWELSTFCAMKEIKIVALILFGLKLWAWSSGACCSPASTMYRLVYEFKFFSLKKSPRYRWLYCCGCTGVAAKVHVHETNHCVHVQLVLNYPVVPVADPCTPVTVVAYIGGAWQLSPPPPKKKTTKKTKVNWQHATGTLSKIWKSLISCVLRR